MKILRKDNADFHSGLLHLWEVHVFFLQCLIKQPQSIALYIFCLLDSHEGHLRGRKLIQRNTFIRMSVGKFVRHCLD